MIDALQMIVFRETATMGIRKYSVDRTKLQRESIIIQTKFGPLAAKKVGWKTNLLLLHLNMKIVPGLREPIIYPFGKFTQKS